MDFIASIPELMASPTLLFRVGTDLYGSEVSDAREVIPQRPMTRVPGAPPFVRGLINIRGTIVTVIDLAMRLDATRPPTESGSILLVRHRGGDRIVGIIVEEVLDVCSLAIDAREGADAGSAITRGVGTVNDAPVVVLDLDVLISQVLHS